MPSSIWRRWNSHDFMHSVLLMVRLFCGDMFDPLVNCFHEGYGRLRCVAFYSAVFFVGNYVLLNVFLAFLLSSFNVDSIVERVRTSGFPGRSRIFSEYLSSTNAAAPHRVDSLPPRPSCLSLTLAPPRWSSG
ncbi:hypothetical protein HPB51_002855 [Rhipicephalus microplus]|uniref:Ion transport domain-containing protein n=1 Tax=Rhipicephalus microplus TaxID=6941 RepID=A0A9J6EWY8_RHIMP|nr:hypothetical protein HPB51_002855 [Rhipicephalus microplus]